MENEELAIRRCERCQFAANAERAHCPKCGHELGTEPQPRPEPTFELDAETEQDLAIRNADRAWAERMRRRQNHEQGPLCSATELAVEIQARTAEKNQGRLF